MRRQMIKELKALLEAEGGSIDSVSVSAISKRFGISEFSIRNGIKEIIEKGLYKG